MRILIISTFFPPLNSIASLRSYSWAKYWSLAGHHVEVLTVHKQHDSSLDLALHNPGFQVREVPLPRWFYWLKGLYRSLSIDEKSGVRQDSEKRRPLRPLFRRFAKKVAHVLQMFRDKTGVCNSCRMPDLTEFWISRAYDAVKELPAWDLLVSTAGPYSVHLVAAKLKKNGKAKKWVADYRDRWSDSCIYPGLFPFSFIEKLRERRLLKQADLITTVSEPFAEVYRSNYPDKTVSVIENGMDPEDLRSLDPSPIFPADGKYRIVYTGSFYPGRRGPIPLFEALAAMRQNPEECLLLARLEVLFAGTNQSGLQQLVSKYQLQPWVKLMGMVDRMQALRLQRDAHALLFIPWGDGANDGILTGKLFEYLYSKTPILAVGGKGLESSQKLILEAKAGVVLSTVAEVRDYLVDHLTHPQKVENAIDPDLLKRYDRQAQAMKLIQLSRPPA